jgi:hypothetical protein
MRRHEMGRGRAVFLLSLKSKRQGKPFSVLFIREQCGLLFTTKRLLFRLASLEKRESEPDTNNGQDNDERS